MLRTILGFTKFWFCLFGKILPLAVAKRLDREGKVAERDALVKKNVTSWARFVVGLSGSTIEVIGEENVPSDTAVVFIANHQGDFDIPILLGYIEKSKAFISKIEILRIPVLSGWMKLMQCTFLDRKNMRQSVRAMAEAVLTVQRGYSLVVFPEGTRSRGRPVGEFKAGSFKLALKTGVPIVPVTIDGSWHLFEETRLFKPAAVRVTVHPAIATAGLSREEATALPGRVRDIIVSAMRK